MAPLWPRPVSDRPQKETLLLLPGMMCDRRLFAPQIKALEDDFDIFVPDLTATSIEQMARDALNSTGAPQFNLAGLSMGGIVAMKICDLAPQRVQRLALLDTNHHADLPERFDIRNRQIADVRQGKLRDVIIEEMKLAYLARANQGNQALLDLLVDMAMDVGADAFVAQSIALRDRPDQTGTLKNRIGATLILCGEEDRLCPPARHQEMASLIGGAVLKILPGAGHISTLEKPQQVTDALRAWLSGHTKP